MWGNLVKEVNQPNPLHPHTLEYFAWFSINTPLIQVVSSAQAPCRHRQHILLFNREHTPQVIHSYWRISSRSVSSFSTHLAQIYLVSCALVMWDMQAQGNTRTLSQSIRNIAQLMHKGIHSSKKPSHEGPSSIFHLSPPIPSRFLSSQACGEHIGLIYQVLYSLCGNKSYKRLPPLPASTPTTSKFPQKNGSFSTSSAPIQMISSPPDAYTHGLASPDLCCLKVPPKMRSIP